MQLSNMSIMFGCLAFIYLLRALKQFQLIPVKKLDIIFYIIGGISIAPAILLPSFSYQIPITFIIMGFFQDDSDSWYCAETPPLAPFIGFIFTSGISWWKIPVVYFLLMLP